MLQDPKCFEENRLKAVSDHRWYETKDEAYAQEKMKLRYSLNGIWKFFQAPNPSCVPEEFEKEGFSCRGWGEITVPAQMELRGYGNPQYTDTGYPWDGRNFMLPEHFIGKRIQLHFEGVETAFHCWINGIYVGYSEDSYTPAVFDITNVVRAGENKLAVEVYRFSTGSWLEDQDFWRMGGIGREVALTAIPEVHMRDIEIAVDLKNEYTTGNADVTAYLDAVPKVLDKGGYTFYWELCDREGNVVKNGEEYPAAWVAEFSVEVESVHLWSAECPYLYGSTRCKWNLRGSSTSESRLPKS